MSSDTYEILALKYAGLAARRRFESFIAADDHDSPHPIDYFIWVIRNAKHTIVVDTGFDAAEGRQARPQGGPGAGRRAGADRHFRRQRGAGCRYPPALRPCRHARRLPQGPLPSAGGRDGLRHGALHVPQLPALSRSRPTTCATWCKNVYSGRVAFHDGDARGRAGRDRAQDRRPQPRTAVRSGCNGHRPGCAGIRQLALLREFREGQSVPHHHRHRRCAGRLHAAAGARGLAAARGARSRSAGAEALSRRSTARRKASCIGWMSPASTAERSACAASGRAAAEN